MPSRSFIRVRADPIPSLGAAQSRYNVVSGDNQLPVSFHQTGQVLPYVTEAVRLIQRELNSGTTDIAEECVQTLQTCNTYARLLEEIFRATAQAQGGERLAVYRAVVRENGDVNTVEALTMEMMREIHALVEAAALTRARERVQWLHDEVTGRLATLEPSVPRTQPPRAHNNYGRGSQVNVSGDIRNENTGSGNQFPWATFSGTVNFGRND